MKSDTSTTSRTGPARIAAAAGAAVLAVALLAVGLAGRDAPAPAEVPETSPAASAPAYEPASEPATRSLTVAPSAPAANQSDKPLAQTYSAYCQTSQGVCVLPTAQPIGSTCACNDVPGRVIP